MIKYFDDENLIIRLWHEAFGDSDEDIVFFLKNCKHKKCLGFFEDDELCSMLFLVDCKVNGNNAKYIYAACTYQNKQKNGQMTNLLSFCKRKYDLLSLIPANDKLVTYYDKRGFKGRSEIKNIIFIPLIGMMLGKIIGSITTFFAYKYDLVQNISSWMEGDMSLIMKGSYELLYLSVPMVIIAFLYANKFTIAGMGESFATNLGLNHARVVNIGLILVSAVSALTLVMVGNIPFLGLIIPNLVSITKGDNLKNSLVETCLFGGSFVLLCDIIGRVIIAPYEVSIGLTVGVIGSAMFLYLVMRRKK